VSIRDIEMHDCIRSSQYDLMLIRDMDNLLDRTRVRNFVHTPRTPIFYLSIEKYSETEEVPEGYFVDIRVLPLKLNIDQDAVILLTKVIEPFLPKMNEDGQGDASMEVEMLQSMEMEMPSQSEADISSSQMAITETVENEEDTKSKFFVRQFRMSSIELSVNYLSKQFSLMKLRAKTLVPFIEAMNMFSLRDALFEFNEVDIRSNTVSSLFSLLPSSSLFSLL
jgi:hypothetical protein